ncbi:PspA/IM30 family protein [Phaeobacter gallaeciensis]|uniref:PspA/IM30 family protein n=1 Tax=Phaeobacter gallaeciensis TaxID=60890 RepID=UPI000BBC6B5A|nr:PspA/IM30 family protein [Phaeobacter gallaeciensis]ATF18762.1 phage shock protein A (PspA) family protein [Phaeobacter gallaeciensis]ATF22871.1 phage shock protein A (PspA) family protein [Phaeobacter gallaeciensis]
MFATIKTLIRGVDARAEERLSDTYAIELIDQKIRSSEADLTRAKQALAGLIQKSRMETRQLDAVSVRIADLIERAQAALADGREDLAQTAASAIAELENEEGTRRRTVDMLEQRSLQLRQSVEASHRRLMDLKQGAIAARATRKAQTAHSGMARNTGPSDTLGEAEALINRVMSAEDPFEQSEILKDIETGLSHGSVADDLADAGFGAPTRSTAADVLARLSAKH